MTLRSVCFRTKRRPDLGRRLRYPLRYVVVFQRIAGDNEEVEKKECSICRVARPLDDYYLKLGKRAASCKECQKVIRRRHYDQNLRVPVAPAGHPCGECGQPVPLKKIGGAPRKFCRRECAVAANRRLMPERARRHVLAVYGLDDDSYAAMVDAQGDRCAICGTDEPATRTGSWHVDHCHDSSKVRGLLCTRCNIGLGQFRDDPARLRAAAEYIERNQ